MFHSTVLGISTITVIFNITGWEKVDLLLQNKKISRQKDWVGNEYTTKTYSYWFQAKTKDGIIKKASKI